MKNKMDGIIYHYDGQLVGDSVMKVKEEYVSIGKAAKFLCMSLEGL